jgi:L-threonylcarbamoyladenylate synthase
MTQIINQDRIDEAAKCIANGGTVAFPTETVYGLGCDAMNNLAIDKVYKAKGRPSDNPLIVHISNPQDVYSLAKEVSPEAKVLIENFWPGPLTIVFPKRSEVPLRVTGGLDTVAVRCPSDRVARDLISKSGKFIAAPSANLSGSPSPTTAKHVIDDLDGRIDYILCGDNSEIGLESTVVDMTSDIPVILRPGAVTLDMISKLIPGAVHDVSIDTEVAKPKCPGMKYKHYSPKADVEVVMGDRESVKNYISEKLNEENNSAVLTCFGHDYENAVCVLNAGNTMNEYASGLFYNLRVFDEYGVKKVYAEFYEADGIGVAVRNRLFKAAGNKITKV